MESRLNKELEDSLKNRCSLIFDFWKGNNNENYLDPIIVYIDDFFNPFLKLRLYRVQPRE